MKLFAVQRCYKFKITLDDYAVSMGLSWLARPTKASSNGDVPAAPSAKAKSI